MGRWNCVVDGGRVVEAFCAFAASASSAAQSSSAMASRSMPLSLLSLSTWCRTAAGPCDRFFRLGCSAEDVRCSEELVAVAVLLLKAASRSLRSTSRLGLVLRLVSLRFLDPRYLSLTDGMGAAETELAVGSSCWWTWTVPCVLLLRVARVVDVVEVVESSWLWAADGEWPFIASLYFASTAAAAAADASCMLRRLRTLPSGPVVARMEGVLRSLLMILRGLARVGDAVAAATRARVEPRTAFERVSSRLPFREASLSSVGTRPRFVPRGVALADMGAGEGATGDSGVPFVHGAGLGGGGGGGRSGHAATGPEAEAPMLLLLAPLRRVRPSRVAGIARLLKKPDCMSCW